MTVSLDSWCDVNRSIGGGGDCPMKAPVGSGKPDEQAPGLESRPTVEASVAEDSYSLVVAVVYGMVVYDV